MSARCWSCKKPYTEAQREQADGDCPHCGVEIDAAPAMGEELPPLPNKHYEFTSPKTGWFTADQMHAYGRACMALRQQSASEPRMLTANGRPIETDAAHRLRLHATNANLSQDLRNDLTKGADECDRFYDGMRAWKQTAEKKDADWSAERMGRINDRCEARATATAPVSQPAAQTVTMTGYQLRDALNFINPDGPSDEAQCESDLTFGVRQHRDDDGKVSTGLCCWNDDMDGEVYPLDGDYTAPQPLSAPAGSEQPQ